MDDYWKTLQRAWRESTTELVPSSHLRTLRHIIQDSTHKTYKYILLTGLLGAAAANRNPLCLQKSCNLDRAWDARSVCHKVIVPFEREYLNNALGGSNEPFLNKPARFQKLSKENAVRAGRDRDTLEKLIEILSTVDDSDCAIDYLKAALQLVSEIKRAQNISVIQPNPNELKKALIKILQSSNQGFNLVFFSALFLHLVKAKTSELKVHPLNQSGASSRQVGDIDIIDRRTKRFLLAVEVKDKAFSMYDLKHAKEKSLAQASGFAFITRHKYFQDLLTSHPQDVSNFQNIITCEGLIDLTASMANAAGNTEVEKIISSVIKATNPKNEVIEHVRWAFSGSH